MQVSTATIVGIVRRVSELRSAGSSQVINLVVPIKKSYRVPEGKPDTDWWEIEVWGKSAENASQSVSVGTQVVCIGTPTQEVYVAKDGTEKSKMVLKSASITWEKINTDEPF